MRTTPAASLAFLLMVGVAPAHAACTAHMATVARATSATAGAAWPGAASPSGRPTALGLVPVAPSISPPGPPRTVGPYAGLFSVDVPNAGAFRIALGGRAWIDVLEGTGAGRLDHARPWRPLRRRRQGGDFSAAGGPARDRDHRQRRARSGDRGHAHELTSGFATVAGGQARLPIRDGALFGGSRRCPTPGTIAAEWSPSMPRTVPYGQQIDPSHLKPDDRTSGERP